MPKKIFSGLAVLLTTVLLLAACRTASVSKEISCADSQILCVGLVTGLGGITDQSFNQMAWEGVLKAQTEKVADRVQYIETIDAKDYDTNITTLAQANYDVIVTVGSLQGEATITAAKNYPQILFIGVDQNQTEGLPNLAGLVFQEDQAGFQAGALAAVLSRSKTIAAILGPETDPAVKVIKQGFEAGAQYIDPLIKIITLYYPDSSEMALADPRWAAGAAAQAIQQGADIIFDGGGLTGNGALAEAASHPGIYCMGSDGDLWENLPEAHPCLVSSTVDNISQGVYDLIKLAEGGTLPSGNYFGTTNLAPFHAFDTVIPQAVKDEMSQLTTSLAEGFITTGVEKP